MNRIRSKTRDAAFQFRMGAGFPGDVNRTHPATIEPAMNDSTNPIAAPGLACLVNTAANTVRGIESTDTAITEIYGVSVRPYPFQVAAASNYGAQSFGTGSFAGGQLLDVLRRGYIMVQIPATQAVTKGGAVFLWVAASSGAHIQGSFENAATGGSTATLSASYTFNGPADATGITELCCKV